MLGVEGPDIEVLDAVLPVDVMQGSALAQGPAQQAAGIAAGTARTALEELGLNLGSQRGEAQKVSYIDAGQRPIHILGHSAILPPKLQDRCDAETNDMRQMSALAMVAGEWQVAREPPCPQYQMQESQRYGDEQLASALILERLGVMADAGMWQVRSLLRPSAMELDSGNVR